MVGSLSALTGLGEIAFDPALPLDLAGNALGLVRQLCQPRVARVEVLLLVLDVDDSLRVLTKRV